MDDCRLMITQGAAPGHVSPCGNGQDHKSEDADREYNVLMGHHRTTRRLFLQRAAGAFAFPHVIATGVRGGQGTASPSNRIVLVLIGAGNINSQHREAFVAEKDVRVVADGGSLRQPRADELQQRGQSAP